MLVDKSVREFLASVSSAAPTPGGGAASALASAVGTSLVMMVAALPKTRTGSPAERNTMDSALRVLDCLKRELTDAIDADAAAYDSVVAAHRLPKATGDERTARRTAVQRAFRDATDVPLAVVRLSVRALIEARTIGPASHPPASSDLRVGTLLLTAGLLGAKLNIEANLTALDDPTYVSSVREEVRRLSQEPVVEDFERARPEP